MSNNKINKPLLNILMISVILLISVAMGNAQLTFYNPFYYSGSYLNPAPYPFYPLYNPIFPAYNTVPALPFYNYNPVYFNPATIPPVSFSAPAITPSPIASVSAATTLAPLSPVTTILGVVIADFLINTGNPQVDAVLNLIILDPTLLDNPILLNALINTGNPDVASALAWLISVI